MQTTIDEAYGESGNYAGEWTRKVCGECGHRKTIKQVHRICGHCKDGGYKPATLQKFYLHGLKQVREELGVTQRDITEQISLQQRTISNYETLKNKAPLPNIEAIAEVLGVHWRDLTDVRRLRM